MYFAPGIGAIVPRRGWCGAWPLGAVTGVAIETLQPNSYGARAIVLALIGCRNLRLPRTEWGAHRGASDHPGHSNLQRDLNDIGVRSFILTGAPDRQSVVGEGATSTLIAPAAARSPARTAFSAKSVGFSP